MADPQGIDEQAPPLTFTQWLICFTAAMGFAFDIFALLMLPLIVRPALLEMGGYAPGTPPFNEWVGRLFYIPAFAGGVFGLLGGYLTDRLGRRRILVWSILLYAFSAFASGFVTSPWMLLVFRCTTFIGVSVEFVAAVAWLAELFPHPKQRETVLGYTQAFSSLGGLMVATANSLALRWAPQLPALSLPDWLHLGGQLGDPHAAWRYTLISGLIPAIPLILIRPFLPESPAWRLKKLSGTMKRPSIAAIFSPQLARTTIITTIMFACSYGAAFGAIQLMPQIVPGLPQVQGKIKEAVAKLPATKPATLPTALATLPASPAVVPEAVRPAPGTVKVDPRIAPVAGRVTQETAASVTKVQEIGGLYGRVILALMASFLIVRRMPKVQLFLSAEVIVLLIYLVGHKDMPWLAQLGWLRYFAFGQVFVLGAMALGWVVFGLMGPWLNSYRSTIRFFQIPGLLVMPIVFCLFAVKDLNLLYVGMFVAGLLTVAQFSFWGNYLPRVYPMHLRGTGESFAANIGGRMIGTSFAWVTATVALQFTAEHPTPVQAAHVMAYTAAGVAFAVYLVGFLMSFLLPEPHLQRDEE